MPDAEPAGGDRWLRPLLLACALAALGACAWLFALRLGYPFELEWMEGAMADHAARVRAGLPIYCPPGPDHVSFLYTPLLYQLAAVTSLLVGEGIPAVRLVGVLATLGCLGLLLLWVRRETRSATAGLVAAGLFCAGYGYLRTWYDLARNDTLFLAGVLTTAYLLRFGGGRAAVLAGVTAALAFLAKQSAVMWLPALGVGILLLDWRRGLWFGASAAVCLGGTVLAGHLLTDGWFTFFVFEMPRGHGIQPDRKLGFWTEDLVPILPLFLGAWWCLWARWRAGRPHEALFLAAVAGGGLATSYLSRLHAGGFDNVMMYVFSAGCLLLPMLLMQDGRLRRGAAVLVLCQFGLLLFDARALWQGHRPALLFDPRAMLPSAAHRQASQELVDYLQTQPGDVMVVFHGHVARLAGKGASAHGQALTDLFQRLVADQEAGRFSAMSGRALESMANGYQAGNAARRWSAIVLDQPHGPIFQLHLGPWLSNYERTQDAPVSQPEALRPPVGMETDSPYVLAPAR